MSHRSIGNGSGDCKARRGHLRGVHAAVLVEILHAALEGGVITGAIGVLEHEGGLALFRAPHLEAGVGAADVSGEEDGGGVRGGGARGGGSDGAAGREAEDLEAEPKRTALKTKAPAQTAAEAFVRGFEPSVDAVRLRDRGTLDPERGVRIGAVGREVRIERGAIRSREVTHRARLETLAPIAVDMLVPRGGLEAYASRSEASP